MITSIELLAKEIRDFSLRKINYIVGFYLSFHNESLLDGSSSLDIDFIIEDESKQYLARFRFYNPESVTLRSGGPYHQISIEIKDIKDRGWEGKKFEIDDYEEGRLHFYCSEIEVMSVNETNYYI